MILNYITEKRNRNCRPTEIIIVEGILVLEEKEIRDLWI